MFPSGRERKGLRHFSRFRSSIQRVRLSRWLPSSRSRLQRRAPIALLRPMPAHHAHAQAVAHACCPSCFQLLGAAVAEWPCYSAANQSAKDFSPDWRQTKDLLGVRYPASNTRAPCPDSRTIFKIEEINSVVKNITPPKPHFLEISPGAGNSNFVKLFARRDVPLSSSSPPPQQCWLCCRSRGSWASRCSCTVLTRCSQGMRSPLMASRMARRTGRCTSSLIALSHSQT